MCDRSYYDERMSNKFSYFATAGLLASLLLSTAHEGLAAYPGNANFRNVPVSFASQNRTDWVTNVSTMVGTARNPGVSTPVNWSIARSIAPGIDYIPAILNEAGGWPTQTVCHLVRINLSTPNLRFTGVDRCANWGNDMPEKVAVKKDGSRYSMRTVREKTSDFLARNRGEKSKGGKERDARLAWNASAWLPWTNPTTNLWACPYSPLYSDGIQISDLGEGGVSIPNGDPAPQSMMVVYKDGTADLIHSITPEIAKKIWFCVPAFVAQIVSDGKPPVHGDTRNRDPRTAFGISKDRKTLYLLFCDGRRPGWSGSCDFPSLSTLLVAMGCWDAINLDGGGSSTFCTWDDAKNRPVVMNRPSNGSSWSLGILRDNGTNAAIYYKAPDAMLGDWKYDNLDFLIQDIIDGETPDKVNAINVLRDATFTAEHPCIPSGRWNLCSTNHASIGWADGLTPQVAANTIVGFWNIRLREGSRKLSVADGGTAILYGGADLDEVDIQNPRGLVLAGVPACPIRVSCATVTDRRQVFARSTLSRANAARAAAKLVSNLGEDYVAVVSGTDGNVSLFWDKRSSH